MTQQRSSGDLHHGLRDLVRQRAQCAAARSGKDQSACCRTLWRKIPTLGFLQFADTLQAKDLAHRRDAVLD